MPVVLAHAEKFLVDNADKLGAAPADTTYIWKWLPQFYETGLRSGCKAAVARAMQLAVTISRLFNRECLAGLSQDTLQLMVLGLARHVYLYTDDRRELSFEDCVHLLDSLDE